MKQPALAARGALSSRMGRSTGQAGLCQPFTNPNPNSNPCHFSTLPVLFSLLFIGTPPPPPPTGGAKHMGHDIISETQPGKQQPETATRASPPHPPTPRWSRFSASSSISLPTPALRLKNVPTDKTWPAGQRLRRHGRGDTHLFTPISGPGTCRSFLIHLAGG